MPKELLEAHRVPDHVPSYSTLAQRTGGLQACHVRSMLLGLSHFPKGRWKQPRDGCGKAIKHMDARCWLSPYIILIDCSAKILCLILHTILITRGVCWCGTFTQLLYPFNHKNLDPHKSLLCISKSFATLIP